MEEDIALLRKEALNTLAPKGSHFRVDDVYAGRTGFSKQRKRLTTPELTREVIGAFGMKPRGRSSFSNDRSRPVNYRHQRKRKSASSSRSVSSGSTRSRSGSFSSYSSKSSSRSRSPSSSSSSRSSYSRSSSYSGSSRSSSVKSEQVTPRQKIGIKRSVARRDFNTIPHSYSGRSLENSQSKKKMKYSHTISSPQKKEQSRVRDHMQIKNPHPRDYVAASRKQSFARDREERSSRTDDYGMRQVYYPKPRNSPPEDFYRPPPKRHPSDKYAYESRPAHFSSPPYIPPRSPPMRPRMNISRDNPIRRDRDSSLDKNRYSRRKPIHIESISPPPHRRRDINFPSYHDDRQTSSEKQRHRAVQDKGPRYSESRRRNFDKSMESHDRRGDAHNYKDKYIVLEDSANSRVDKRNPTTRGEDKWRKSATDKQKRDVQKSKQNTNDSPGVSKTSTVNERKKEVDKDKKSKKAKETEHEPVKKAVKQVSAEKNNISLGVSEYVEELDYNEDMDNLDVHPTGILEEEEDAIENVSSKLGSNHSDMWSDADDKNSGGGDYNSGSSPEDRSIGASDTEDVDRIHSPIRVSPDGNGRQPKSSSRATREGSWSRHGRLPVKQRLYLSKQKIEEKKRSVVTRLKECESPSELRPSLANRLGPPHHQLRHGDNQRRRKPNDRQPKGDAMAIAEAYRRKKRHEEKKKIRLRKEVHRPRNSKVEKTTGEKSQQKLEAHKDDGEPDKELALDKRIHQINEQNKAIMKRKQEVEIDKEKYG